MHSHLTARRRSRHGFTLVELLVVISILLLVSLSTVYLINSTLDSDRGRSGARILQSMLAGAKDRALHDREIRGVRLLKDQTGGKTASRFIYVGGHTTYATGTVIVGRPDFEQNGAGDGSADVDEVRVVYGFGTNWKKLYDRGLLVSGSRIKLPKSGSWYTVDTSFMEEPQYSAALNSTAHPGAEILLLSHDYLNPATNAMPQPDAFPALADYELELQPAIRPNQEPTPLPRNIYVDLGKSFIPSAISTPNHVDLMFSPRGAVSGPASATGFVHFVLRDLEDIETGRTLIEAQREQYLVTVMCKTGSVESYPVHLKDDNGNGVPDDPFFYAETGKRAGQ